ncbi:MAG: SufS family cysteine desulfurase [Candidatus Beckwithbacteria bacterium]|nr:SufS family cysteine desulfurase [Candidatus Beckwithbacteria bacterium]
MFMLNIKQIKQDFPILKRKVNGKRLVYLDNAATSQRPLQVIKAMRDFDLKHNANVHRGLHILSEEASELYEKSREAVAKFVGANSDEIIFVRNTTEGINLVAKAWTGKNIDKDGEILATVMEHHSNILPWMQLGLTVRFVDVTDEGVLDMEDFKKKLTKKTKLISVGHMSNMTGTINPVAEIVRMARKVKARVLIDGAQSVQHVGIDVKKINCDWLAFSGHKMLGPMGIGALYIKKERQEEMGVFLTGGGMISEVYIDKPAVWARGVEKWEAGTPNVEGAVGLAAACEYHNQLGLKNIREHEKALTAYALKELARFKEIKIYGPKNVNIRGGVLSFSFKGVHAHDVAQVLDSEGVAVRSGHHCTMPLHQRFGLVASTRASFYIYNDKKDIDALIKALEKVRKVFK